MHQPTTTLLQTARALGVENAGFGGLLFPQDASGGAGLPTDGAGALDCVRARSDHARTQCGTPSRASRKSAAAPCVGRVFSGDGDRVQFSLPIL